MVTTVSINLTIILLCVHNFVDFASNRDISREDSVYDTYMHELVAKYCEWRDTKSLGSLESASMEGALVLGFFLTVIIGIDNCFLVYILRGNFSLEACAHLGHTRTLKLFYSPSLVSLPILSFQFHQFGSTL